MKPITDYANSLGTLPLNNSVRTSQSFYQAYQEYLAPNEEKVGIGLALGSRLFQKSALATTDGQNKIISALDNIAAQVNFPTGTLNPLSLGYGGPLQILVTAPSSYQLPTEGDTSSVTPAWRNATWHVIAGVAIPNQATAAQYVAAFKKAHAIADNLTAVAGTGSGAVSNLIIHQSIRCALITSQYQNEADTFQTDPQDSYWGSANYAKLSQIKSQVDPGNLLTCHQCIGWTSTDPRYGCYPNIS